MSSPASPNRTTPTRRRRGALFPTLVVVALLVIGFVFFANVYTEVLWFNQIGFLDVFWRENAARGLIFLSGFLLMSVSVYVSIRVAYRARPIYAPDSQLQDNLNRYQAQLEPVRRAVMIGVPAVFGLFAGTAAMAQWQKVLLFLFQEPFGSSDPQFHLDISFFTNTLPFLGFVSGFLISVVLVSAVTGLLTHYLYGAIRLQERGLFTSRAAQIHLAVLAAAFLLLLGVNFWLDRYATVQDNGGLRSGALYTDVNAVIPTKAILAVAALIVAVLFIVTAVIGRWRLPVIGTAMLVITSILAGGIYPWVVQQFQVRPSESTLEAEYIQRNIDMTRAAYGLNDVEATAYNATTDATQGALRQDAETAANIRLLDPNLISSTFGQLEQYRPYYRFPSTLNVDRYTINGKVQDTVIAVRELNPDGINPAQQTWYNKHLVYTHGYGVVAAYGNTATVDGKPVFMQSGVPSNGELGTDSSYQPRIYFGQYSPDYSIVGAPENTPHVELDRPQTSGGSGDSQTTFTGNGGPSIGNWFNRLLYSIKFQSSDLLLTNGVNSSSQILYDRTPEERIKKVAPYLTIDGNPYPAVVDGRVKWIVDGYTTSPYYPYSQQQQLESATTDSLTERNGTGALPNNSINYLRNSVKATVDAYDGSVSVYAWDDKDPILKAWENVFPNTVKPFSQMSGDLMSHVRYPEDLFKVQRELLGRYHVTNPSDFYNNTDAWSVPNDPTTSNEVKQPPYYLSLQMPGQSAPAFSLTSSFIPQSVQGTESRNVLYGYLAADGDAGSKPGVKAEGYGKLRLLTLPTDTQVPGPGQVQNTFNADPTVSQALNLLRQGSSTVLNGNLLTLPVGGGLLYVQPVYVKSTGETSYPVLQRVLVAFGDKIGFAPTLNAALDQLFGGNSGAAAGDSDKEAQTTTPGTSGSSGGTTGEDPTAKAQLNQALNDANQAIRAGQDALAKGDFAGYGTAQKKLSDAIAAALDAESRLEGTPAAGDTATAAPTAGATDTTTTPPATPSATPPANPAPSATSKPTP
ncbi:MAG: integral rane protein [Micrococcaceae bacterium]|nr:integral rane protein [Micrococcaceae bacterium]